MEISFGKWQRVIELIDLAKEFTSDFDTDIDDILEIGQAHSLDVERSVGLLTRIIEKLRTSSFLRQDLSAAASLEGNLDEIVNEMISLKKEIISRGEDKMHSIPMKKNVILQDYNGIKVQPVFPTPWFHEKEIPMFGGFVRTRDINLWSDNDRLDIHINQFIKLNGRQPDARDLLAIMLSKMSLPGISEKDEFKIMDLARSIANNGVRRSPIIDRDGTLLDGNRRVSACYFILNSNEFTIEQKARAEYIFVWQLSEHATDDDRRRVVVSMNFEKDQKQDWPEYVKAQKIYEDWQSMLAIEPHAGAKRQGELKRELSSKYALGPDPKFISRYIRMFEAIEAFEMFHIEERERDEYEVKHKSSEYFQYFDELTKGSVKSTLDQDEKLRNLVYDLLLQDKFVNWKQIRDIPKISKNEEARKLLRKSRSEADIEEAQDDVISACSLVQIESIVVGANERIENFTKFLLQLHIGALEDGTLSEQSLVNLEGALERVSMLIRNNGKSRDDRVNREEEDGFSV